MKVSQARIIGGYRLLELQAGTGPGELWKAAAPGGGLKTVRFLPGTISDLAALRHLASLDYPALVRLEKVEFRHDELILVREMPVETLQSLLSWYRANQRTGLPRAEALMYLREAAEVLDLATQKYGLQHLSLCPALVALNGQPRVRLIDFGVAQCLTQRAGGPVAALELGAFGPPYAAPELSEGKVTLSCDQYSLAAIYFELLAGRRLSLETDEELDALPVQDRAATARALDPDPACRFPTCTDYIRTMLTADTKSVRHAGRAAAPPRVARSKSAREGSAAPGTGGLPGYRLLECLGHNSLGEVWKAETFTGGPRLVRFLFGAQAAECQEKNSVERLRSLQHETLAPALYLRDGNHRLAVVADPGKLSLAGRFRRCQADGQPGIPRHELLDYLRVIAEGLDALYAASGLQHLGLTGRQIYAGNGPPRMIDFGLAMLFWVPAGQQAAALEARYAAPEVLQGNVTRAADQYSLAVLFQEMLTGYHPFRNLSAQEMLTVRRPASDLSMLPSADRPALARALHLDPEQRFASCGDFVAALEKPNYPEVVVWPPTKLVVPAATKSSPFRSSFKPTTTQIVGELVQAATGSVELREYRGIRFLLRTGQSIEHRCHARLLPGTVWLKLEGFCQAWHAVSTAVDVGHLQFFLPAPARWWEQFLGRPSGLEVHIRMDRPTTCAMTVLAELALDIFPCDRDAERGAQLLEKMGPRVLESLRQALNAHKDRRDKERLPFDQVVQVCPILPNLARGEPIHGQSRDISLHGMGLTLARGVGTSNVAVRLAPGEGAGVITLPGRIVHAAPLADGKVSLGVNFANQPVSRPLRPAKLHHV